MRKIVFLLSFLTVFLLSNSVEAKKKILLAVKQKGDFSTYLHLLKKELEKSYDLIEVDVNKISYKDFEEKYKNSNPAAMILMDNLSVSFAKELYQSLKPKIPSIAVMGLNLKKNLEGNAQICGIAYEVPAYTLLTNFRSVSGKEVKKVLVFYRSSEFEKVVEKDKKVLAMESIKLHAVNLDSVGDIKAYLSTEGKKLLLDKEKPDAIYVLLDSVILSQDLFQNFWLPMAKDSKVPFVVPTQTLVSERLNFGVFGMSPNLSDLASQTSQMLESVMSNKRKCKDIGVEELIGVDSYWNQKQGETLNIDLQDGADVKILGE